LSPRYDRVHTPAKARRRRDATNSAFPRAHAIGDDTLDEERGSSEAVVVGLAEQMAVRSQGERW
jgi:hypothetical protein